MTRLRLPAVLLCAGLSLFAAKKVISPTTTGANDQIDVEATLTMDESEVSQKIGADPGKGIVLLQVKVTPKTDTPVHISPDDFILLAHDDGERHQPFEPSEIAGAGAMVVKDSKQGTAKKTSAIGGLGGMIGGGSGSSPGNSRPVNLKADMDAKKAGNDQLLKALEAKAFPTKDTNQPVEGYLYFQLDGKHKLKNLEVLYRGPTGKLNLDFVH